MKGKQCLLSFKAIRVKEKKSLYLNQFILYSVEHWTNYFFLHLIYSNIQHRELLFAYMTVMMGVLLMHCINKRYNHNNAVQFKKKEMRFVTDIKSSLKPVEDVSFPFCHQQG